MTPSKFSEQRLVEQPALGVARVSSATRSSTGSASCSAPEHVGAGGLGRDDQSEVILRHRLRPKLAELNPELPAAALDAAVEELIARPLRDGSASREPGGVEAAARRRQGHVHRTTTASASPRPSGSSTGGTPANNDYLAVTPVLGRRPAAQAPLRHRLLRQRHPARALRAEGQPQERRARLLERTCATTATRSRSCSRRTRS